MIEGILNRLGYERKEEKANKVSPIRRSASRDAGGASSGVNRNWNPTGFRNKASRKLDIKKSRDLVDNDAFVRSAADVLTRNAIGNGIIPNPATGAKTVDRRIRGIWDREFVNNADVFGRLSIYALQEMVFKAMFTSGECFLVRRTVNDGKPLRTRLHFMATEQLDESVHSDNTDDGIEYNSIGEPVAYHLYPRTPEGNRYHLSKPVESVRVPARDVIHFFDPGHNNYDRGFPWTQPAIEMMRQVSDIMEAEAQRRQIEACHVAAITSPAGSQANTDDFLGHPLVTDADGEPIADFSPGLIAHLAPGLDVSFNNPKSSGDLPAFLKSYHMIISAGLRVPYALAAGDYESVSYTSYRAAILEFRRSLAMIQNNLLFPRYRKIYGWFLEELSLRGQVRAGVSDGVAWIPPKIEFLDPQKDVAADANSVQFGFTTMREELMKRGKNPDEHLAELKDISDELDDLGLNISIVPSATATQDSDEVPSEFGTDPNEEPPEEAEEGQDESQEEDAAEESSEGN